MLETSYTTIVQGELFFLFPIDDLWLYDIGNVTPPRDCLRWRITSTFLVYIVLAMW